MKIGLDIHGVSDKLPDFFSEFSRLYTQAGHEVHVMTGSHIEQGKIKERLKEMGIHYTHLFSIADYHKENNTDMWHDEKGNPWISDEAWDKTKSDYSRREKLDLVIDDTKRYHKYFTTPFMYVKIFKDGEQEVAVVRKKVSLISKLRNIEKWLNKKIGWFTNPPSKTGKEEQNKMYQ